MTELGEIDPHQTNYEEFPEEYYSDRVHKRIHDVEHSTILPGTQTTLRAPTLCLNQLTMPNSNFISVKLELTGVKDKAQFIVKNVGRALIDDLKYRLGSTTVQEIDGYGILATYNDLHLPEKELQRLVYQGVQTDAGLKVRMGSEGATATDGTTAIKKAYGNRFKIPLDFELFNDIGPMYPNALQNSEILYDFRFAQASKIVKGSAAAKITASDKDYSYKLTDTMLERDEFTSPRIASLIESKYQNLRLLYKKISRKPLETMGKSETMKNLTINAEGEIMGILILYTDEATQGDFNSDNDEFYNPGITQIDVSYKGSNHRLFENGILPRDDYDNILKLYPNTTIVEEKFRTTAYATWLDFRLSSKNSLHGSGYRFKSNEPIHLQIKKKAESGKDKITMHIYVFQDAYLLNTGGVWRVNY